MTPDTRSLVETIKAALTDALALAGDDFPWYDEWTCSKPSPWERKKVCEAAIPLLDTLARRVADEEKEKSPDISRLVETIRGRVLCYTAFYVAKRSDATADPEPPWVQLVLDLDTTVTTLLAQLRALEGERDHNSEGWNKALDIAAGYLEERDRLRGEVERVREVVDSLIYLNDGDGDYCRECHNGKSQGHLGGCLLSKIQQALAASKEGGE